MKTALVVAVLLVVAPVEHWRHHDHGRLGHDPEIERQLKRQGREREREIREHEFRREIERRLNEIEKREERTR